VKAAGYELDVEPFDTQWKTRQFADRSERLPDHRLERVAALGGRFLESVEAA